MRRFIATVILTSIPWALALAEIKPMAFPKDTRIKRVPYEENNVVPIYGMTFTSTQILFSRDEHVMDVEGGDTAGWIVTHHPQLANMIFLKPTVLGSNSNMTVVTNKHIYYFHIISNKTLSDAAEKQTYAIKFTYPEDERARLNAKIIKPSLAATVAKNPQAYNWNYRFSGSAQLIPLHVFDDGTFTYFELKKNQAVPAIFAVDDRQGKESVVNTRREGQYLVVQRLAPQFTLRHGGIVASVFNSNEITRIRNGS